MKTEDLDKLLAKYYEGNTTEEEEIVLRKFFNGGNIPDGYEAEKEIFSYYSGREKIPVPSADFENRILAAVDKNISATAGFRKRRLVYSLMSAAAGILLLFGSYFFFLNRSEPDDTFSDPDLAYAETMKILFKVSSKLNQGTGSLHPLSKMQLTNPNSLGAIEKSATIFDEKMQNLEYLMKAMEMVALPSKDSLNK